MVLSPLNSIVDDVLMKLAQHEHICGEVNSDRNKKHKLNVLFRFEILRSMLDILQKFGTQPLYNKNQKVVTRVIRSHIYGVDAIHSSQHGKSILVTGFTAAFFLTLPEFFLQWKKYKDCEEAEQPTDSPANFCNKQCLWPTFSNPQKRKADTNMTCLPGCMYSNAKCSTPYGFLPMDVFDLDKIFSDCLSGKVIWTTPTLQDPTKTKLQNEKSPAENQGSHETK